jgi:hypothetical protein
MRVPLVKSSAAVELYCGALELNPAIVLGAAVVVAYTIFGGQSIESSLAHRKPLPGQHGHR